MENKEIKCPFCGEAIKASAKKCKWCGEWLSSVNNQVQTNYSEPAPNTSNVHVVDPISHNDVTSSIKRQHDRHNHVVTEVPAEISNILQEKLAVEPNQIRVNSHFQNDLGADSLDIVELIMEVEDCYKIDIPDDESENMKTVADLLRFLREKGVI